MIIRGLWCMIDGGHRNEYDCLIRVGRSVGHLIGERIFFQKNRHWGVVEGAVCQQVNRSIRW